MDRSTQSSTLPPVAHGGRHSGYIMILESIRAGTRPLSDDSLASEVARWKDQAKAAAAEQRRAQQQYEACRGELDACKAQLQNASKQIQTLSQIKGDLEKQKQRLEASNKGFYSVQAKLHETESRLTRKLNATKALLEVAGSLPYTDLLDEIERFNNKISEVAVFLEKNIVYRCLEAFQEELDRAREDTEGILGDQFCHLVVSQAKNADLGVGAPNPLFVEAVVRAFVVAVCVSEISPHSVFGDRFRPKDGADSDRSCHRLETSVAPSTIGSFKSLFLAKLSNILKIAAWSIPGVQKRTAFESLLVPMFESKEELRTALGETFSSAKLELSVIKYGGWFSEEFMEAPHTRGAGADWVAATLGVGLKQAVRRDGQEEVLRAIVPAQVVLISTLNLAVEGTSEPDEKGSQGPLQAGASTDERPQRDGRDASK
ncbi:hypothetical protein NLJ89_g9786 [Agrocybe chaxingu]|uniref:Uncharacterized protein n=1 Tax=Agrocybe chaxingu TaxID=84603 RepID=A0A9W8MSR3_9AGAR|nr:hypothetical protein NLJ89_g9786 [Agrocybe chaxingu]